MNRMATIRFRTPVVHGSVKAAEVKILSINLHALSVDLLSPPPTIQTHKTRKPIFERTHHLIENRAISASRRPYLHEQFLLTSSPPHTCDCSRELIGDNSSTVPFRSCFFSTKYLNGWNPENAEKSNGTLALANAGTHWIVLSRS